MSEPSSAFDIAAPPAAGEPSPPQRVEKELARRIYRVVALAETVLLALYSAVYAVHGRPIVVAVLAAQLLPLGWAAAVEAPRRRHVRALLVLFWPLFAALWAMAFVQGGLAGATVWWLLVPPVTLIQVGATRHGLAMAALTLGELLACQALVAAGRLPLGAGPPLGSFQAVLAATGSVGTLVGLVWIGARWRRELLQALDTLRADAEEATRVKSRFIANMSHEIRTPLNGIVGAAELLRLSGLDAAQAQAAQIIDHSAQALLAVVNDVLDFSKLEAGRVELEHIGLDPSALAYETAETFSGQAHARGVELWAHACAAVPALIRSDPVRVRQILHNLVSNAMKFTQAGEIRIEVDLLSAPAGGGPALRFAVRDTGIGLDLAQQARLFQAFTQADVSTTRRFGGTGLGLVICRELASLLGGRLELESAPGVGSTFCLILPIPPSAAQPAAGAATRAHEPGTSSRAPAALVICCASRALAADLRDWAERAGYRVEASSCGTPDDWLLLARATGADTVVMDDESLRAMGLSRGTWAARLRRSGLHGVLLLGVSVPVVAVPEGVVPLYKPARPLRLEGALREARRGLAMRRDALQPAVADEGPAPVAAAGTTSAPGPLPEATVLLVEDNPVNQAVARALLAQLRIGADVAEDGDTALHMLEHGADRYAAVLMDCHMPVLDGFAATRRWREREGVLGRPRLPVIAMTANSLADAGPACAQAGMDDFMAKPFTLGELERVLARWGLRPPAA